MHKPDTGKWKVKRIDLIFISALLLLSSMLPVTYHIKNKVIVYNRWTAHTFEVLISLDSLHRSLLEAESSRRGYILTGDAQQKEQYQVSAQRIPEQLLAVKRITATNKLQQQRLIPLEELITARLAKLASSIDAREKEGYRQDAQARLTAEGGLIISRLSSRIDEMKDTERDLLRERRNAEQTAMQSLLLAVLVGILTSIGILSITFIIARREAGERGKTAGALTSVNQNITNLSEMAQFLQSCSTLGEASQILARYGERFFPQDSGGICLINASRNLLSQVAGWGNVSGEELFGPDQCWALRLGQPHLSRGKGDVRCTHVADSAAVDICIPLAAHHETLGVLHIALASPESAELIQKKKTMAVAFAEQIALALRNLQLREQLRELSIRDPLTGLLNRRYMEESLQREIARAVRSKTPLSVIMLDVDHFKRFNDTFGHEAGDHVLKEFGHLLQKVIRGSDIACRFGGEEFTLILPEASRTAALDKGNALREAVKGLQLMSGKQALGKITISAGVAVFPDNGDTPEHLLASSDAALYRAKEMGRDRVE